MENKKECIKTKGEIDLYIQNKEGIIIHKHFKNTVLDKGRQALASSLAHAYGSSYNFYIDTMWFGTGGVDGSNNPKYVDSSRTGLFTPVLSKGASVVVDVLRPNELIVTSVLAFDDMVGEEISELGLAMASGDIYSMATIPMVSKTSQIQLTWNWTVSFV